MSGTVIHCQISAFGTLWQSCNGNEVVGHRAGQRMLRHTVQRNHQLSARSIAADLQTSCGLQICSGTGCRELRGIGFHGWTAVSRRYITKCNVTLQKWRCKALCHSTLGLRNGNVIRLEWHIMLLCLAMPFMSLSSWGARRTVPNCIANCTLVEGDYGVGLFFRGWAWPLAQGTLNASACQDILDNAMLPKLWQQFVDGPLIFQHGCALAPKAKSMKTRMSMFGVEAHSPDITPTPQHLKDDL